MDSACSSHKLPIAYNDLKLGRVCTACYDEWNGREDGPEQDSDAERLKKSKARSKAKLSKVTGKSALHVAAAGISSTDKDKDIIISGHMKIKQAGLFSSWKRSWFVLKRDFCLYQYLRPEDVVAQNSIPLPGQ